MSKQSMAAFRAWLRKQRRRDDPVGDFARDFLADPDAEDCLTLSSLDRHLKDLWVEDKVLEARDRAWREYELDTKRKAQ